MPARYPPFTLINRHLLWEHQPALRRFCRFHLSKPDYDARYACCGALHAVNPRGTGRSSAGWQVSTCWRLDVGESTMQDDARRIGCATSTHVEPVAEGGIAGSQVNFHGSCQMHLSTSLFEGNCAHRFLWVLDFFGLDRLDRLKEHARERERAESKFVRGLSVSV